MAIIGKGKLGRLDNHGRRTRATAQDRTKEKRNKTLEFNRHGRLHYVLLLLLI